MGSQEEHFQQSKPRRRVKCLELTLILIVFVAAIEFNGPAIKSRLSWVSSLIGGHPKNNYIQHELHFLPVLGEDDNRLPLTSTSADNSCMGPLGLMSRPQQHITPASHPFPSLGSYKLTNIDQSKCMTYSDRYEPYTDHALGITYLNDYHEWLSLQPDYFGLDKTAAVRLSNANEKVQKESIPQWGEIMSRCQEQSPSVNKMRTAVLLRVHQNYTWHKDDVLNMRALITELSLNNADRFDVRILLEVYQRDLSIYSSSKHRRQVLSHSVPREFWEMTELWNEGSIEVLYPDLSGTFLNHMTAQNSYRSSFMPVQKFALEHTEYDYIWNWEMENRFSGNYLELFESSREFARQEALHSDAQKYKTWLVPNDFQSEALWAASNHSKPIGNGQEADLIVFNPIFDPRESGWYWEHDIQNYRQGESIDRRASIGRNVRFSRPLLDAMNIFNAQEGKSAHCETWPATVVLHSNQDIWLNGQEYSTDSTSNLSPLLKAVYVPHAVYVLPQRLVQQLSSHLRLQDFYRKVNEKFLRGATFYDQADMGSKVYSIWKSEYRSCMAPTLLGPVRRVK